MTEPFSDLLPSSKKEHLHPLAQFLTNEDFELANDARKEHENKEIAYDKEIERRTNENRKMMRELVPVGIDKEADTIKERRKKLEEESIKRYERDLTGTRVKTRDEMKWQVRRKKVQKDLDINNLRWQEENRKRQLLSLAENDITRDIRIQRGIELEDSDYFTSTTEMTQKDLLENSDINTKAKVFNLALPSGPSGYIICYNTSGRHMLITKRSGFIASLEWRSFNKVFEMKSMYNIQGTAWMMDDTMEAVTGNDGTVVFNDKGEQIHYMKEFKKFDFIQYLPYHFTLVIASSKGIVSYKDISIGDKEISIQMKPITAMCQNPYNGIIILGHADGQISMVTPRDKSMEPVVSMLCHKSPIIRVAVDITGTYMVTSSKEGITKVWEIKKSFKEICKYKSPTCSFLTISQTGMLALGIRNQILIWRQVSQVSKNNIYLINTIPGKALITSLAFCPYEDILGYGTTNGVGQILVPGSGMADFDTRTANPYSKDRTVSKLNVDMLLEKIPLDMICLDPDSIGTSGIKQKEHAFDGNVQLTENLKKELNTMGVRQKIERKKSSEVTRDEIRKEREQKDREFKENVKEWYEEESPNPLDRFASLGKRKRKQEEEQKRKSQKLEDDSSNDEENGEYEENDEIDNEMQVKEESDSENDIESKLSNKYEEISEDEGEFESDDEDEDEELDEENSVKSENDSDESEEITRKVTNSFKTNKQIVQESNSEESEEESDDSSDSEDDSDKQKRMLAFSFGRK